MGNAAKPPRVFLIHATPLAIPAINDSFRKLWPEARLSNLLDDSLPADLQQAGKIDSEITRRLMQLSRYAHEAGADGIVFTCSSFGAAIDFCKNEIPIPVLRPNEAMVEEAFRHGDRMAIIATFEPAIASISEEFHQMAASKNRGIRIDPVFVPGALKAAQSGDMALHNELVARACALAVDADVLCFAQFSMTPAAESSAAISGQTVLTTPDSAVKRIRSLLEQRI